jgi:hypothetical protein
MGPSLLSKTLQGTAILTFFGATSFVVLTKHCQFSSPAEFNPSTDPSLFGSKWIAKYNPKGYPATYDECVRRVSLRKIREDVLKDAQNG